MFEAPDPATSSPLSAVLIVPDERRRTALRSALVITPTSVVREMSSYPSAGGRGELAGIDCDVAIVDLDSNTASAVDTVEDLCARNPNITVMACSGRNDAALLQRVMQAGAREFLLEPLTAEAVSAAISRALSRRPRQVRGAGKTLVFVPAKGGVGATTLAANFAMALTKESEARVVVVDTDFQLGEVALGLGMTATFSVVDALRNLDRLDWDFLSTLLIRHRSGLSVLAAPEEYSFFQLPDFEGAARLFRILREHFDYVVVDAGTNHGNLQETLFELADTLYLITELTLPSLRNSHRMISWLSSCNAHAKLEVVLNRYNSRHGDIDEASAVKALGRPVNWRVPNGYAAARSAQDNGVPLALESSPITKALVQMAKAACGKPLNPEKKPGRGFSFFGSKALPEPVEI